MTPGDLSKLTTRPVGITCLKSHAPLTPTGASATPQHFRGRTIVAPSKRMAKGVVVSTPLLYVERGVSGGG